MTLTIRPIKLDPRERAMCEQRVTFTGACGAKSNYLVQFLKSHREKEIEIALCREHAHQFINQRMVMMAQAYGEIDAANEPRVCRCGHSQTVHVPPPWNYLEDASECHVQGCLCRQYEMEVES